MKDILKVGLDIHGVIDTFPKRFCLLSNALVAGGAEVHIVTGSQKDERINQLLLDNNIQYTHYFSIVNHLIETGVTIDWRGDQPWANEEKWNNAKRDYCEKNKIDFMIDDSPIYRDTFDDIDSTFLHLINRI